MKRKIVGIIIAMLVLALAGGTAWSLRDMPQKRLLRAAENVVFADADSAAALLARVDTTRLTASSLMLYDLLRAMVYEERWYLRHADTTVCLTSDAETWNFNRQSDDRKPDDALTPDDSSRLRVFHYYEELSLGGTTDDEDALRRFGRACFVLSRRQNDSIVPMQVNQLFHLAIHCAETTGDHALAYRAYDKYFNRLPFHNTAYPEFYLHRALEHYRLSPDQPRWLLTMLNDYGYTVLLRAPFDLHHFGTLEHAAALAARQFDAPPSPAVTDAVYQCLDSLWALPHDDFSYTCSLRVSKSTFTFGEVTVPVGMYEEVQQEHHEDGTKHWRPSYESETKKEEQNFAVNRDTYLAPGYVKKSAGLQRRLMTAVIGVLMLAVLVLLLVFRNWLGNVRRRHEAGRAPAPERRHDSHAARTHHGQERNPRHAGADGRQAHRHQRPQLARDRDDPRHRRRQLRQPPASSPPAVQRGGHPTVYAGAATALQHGPLGHLRHLCLCRAAPQAEAEERRLRCDRPRRDLRPNHR